MRKYNRYLERRLNFLVTVCCIIPFIFFFMSIDYSTDKMSLILIWFIMGYLFGIILLVIGNNLLLPVRKILIIHKRRYRLHNEKYHFFSKTFKLITTIMLVALQAIIIFFLNGIIVTLTLITFTLLDHKEESSQLLHRIYIILVFVGTSFYSLILCSNYLRQKISALRVYWSSIKEYDYSHLSTIMTLLITIFLYEDLSEILESKDSFIALLKLVILSTFITYSIFHSFFDFFKSKKS